MHFTVVFNHLRHDVPVPWRRVNADAMPLLSPPSATSPDKLLLAELPLSDQIDLPCIPFRTRLILFALVTQS